MTPVQFLALTQTPANAPAATSSRAYRATGAARAGGEGRDGGFLTLHTPDGQFHSLPYSHLRFISGDDRGGTVFKLTFQAVFVIKGRQLLPVVEAVRKRQAMHLHVFNGAAHDPPEPGEPIITSIEIEAPNSGRPAHG